MERAEQQESPISHNGQLPEMLEDYIYRQAAKNTRFFQALVREAVTGGISSQTELEPIVEEMTAELISGVENELQRVAGIE